MLRRIGSWFGASRLSGGSSHWSPDWLVSAGLPPSRGVVNPQHLSAALRCAAVLSDALSSQLPFGFAPIEGGGRTRIVSDATRALHRTRYVDWETAFIPCQLRGNGFLHIHRNERGGPRRLVGIPSRLVSVAVDHNGRVWYEVTADEQLGVAEQILPASDVIHIRARCMDNPLIGVSPLRAAGASIANVTETVTLQKSLYHNINTASIVFSTDMDLTKEQMAMLREAVDNQTKRLKAGGSLILANGLKADRGANGTTAHDETLIDALEFGVREIARTYGVPPSMLGQADQSSYNTASEERRAFLTSTLQPWAMRVASELTEKLLSEADRTAGHVVEYDFTSALLGHGQERAETLSKLTNAGIVTVNEARNWQGLPDIPGGDMLRAPINSYPLNEWLAFGPTPAPSAQKPAEGSQTPPQESSEGREPTLEDSGAVGGAESPQSPSTANSEPQSEEIEKSEMGESPELSAGETCEGAEPADNSQDVKNNGAETVDA